MKSMPDWIIEQNRAGDGTVKHLAAPRFTARWTTGDADFSGMDGLFWQEEGSDSEDSLTLHNFQWEDKTPDQATFEELMMLAPIEN
jgi:hypothetical protein